MEILSHAPKQTAALAHRIGALLQPGDVVAYRGDLGAGKTYFTAALAQGLGIAEPVASPTFALVNVYKGADATLCHFDMYRISGFDDLYSTGFFDYLDGQCILAVEWSENLPPDVLPPHTLTITLDRPQEPGFDDDCRRITLAGNPRILKALAQSPLPPNP